MGVTLQCLVILAIGGGAIVFILWNASQNNKAAAARLQSAWEDYQRSLMALKAAPTNADLKQQTLALGRAYSAMSRADKAVTTYDELALSNDINAATAGATASQAVLVQPAPSVEQRLQSLDGLRTKGLISDQEYAARRQQLIGEV